MSHSQALLYSPTFREEVFSETHLQIIENLFTRGAKTAPSTPDRHGLLPQHLVVLGKNALIIVIYTPDTVEVFPSLAKQKRLYIKQLFVLVRVTLEQRDFAPVILW
jgi:hypothetical protein